MWAGPDATTRHSPLPSNKRGRSTDSCAALPWRADFPPKLGLYAAAKNSVQRIADTVNGRFYVYLFSFLQPLFTPTRPGTLPTGLA